MVTPFIIKHISESDDEMTYTGDNITNITMEFNTPIAPMPFHLQKDKKILVTTNTFMASVSSIILSGNEPVLVDIDEDTLYPEGI